MVTDGMLTDTFSVVEVSNLIDYTPLITDCTYSVINVVLFAALAICGVLCAHHLFGGWRT